MIYITNLCMVALLLSSACSNKNLAPLNVTIKKPSINDTIEEIIKSTDPDINIGVSIIDLDTNKIIFEKNPNRYFVPASSQKIITLAAALYYLGPSYRFTTQLVTDNYDHKNKSLHDLYVQGSGDPGLMDTDLLKLALEIKQMGIKEITGDIYVDDFIFDDILWGKGAMWDDRPRGYAAPVCGLNLNYNKIIIKTKPGFVAGSNALVSIEPFSNFISINNQTKTLSNSSSNIVIAINPSSTDNQGLKKDDEIIIKGQVGLNNPTSYYTLAFHDPGLMVATFLANQLTTLNIKFKGEIKRKKTPESSIKVTSHLSRTLSEALIDFIKISNDMATDSLIKVIAAQNSGLGTYNKGLSLVKEFLSKEVGFKNHEIIVADGSGLSRYNLITPKQMVNLLAYANNKFPLGPEFMVALPIAGSDGTLTNRFKNSPNKSYVRAKTGAMSGINSLVGYTTMNNSNKIAFAIMINGFIGSSAKYTNLQEKIVGILSENSTTFLTNSSD